MDKITNKHTITDELYLFKRERSKRWNARFKLNNEWYSKSTKEKALNEAIVRAIQLQTEYRISLSNNFPLRRTRKHTFSVVADLAIKRLEQVDTQSYKQYISYLNKYHKPYFGDYAIRECTDTEVLLGFDKWRIDKMGKVPAHDTVKDHNTAMNRVFDEAVINKYITASEVPKLTNTGRSGERRASFTKDEYERIVTEAKTFVTEQPQKRVQEIRKTLLYYIQFAALSGIRPGTEMEQLTWGDVDLRKGEDKTYITITVRKGKTTKHTGTREVICKDELEPVIAEMIKGVMHEPEEEVFKIGRMDTLGKSFVRLLKKLNLYENAHGKRSLYSLRHSFVTWELERGTAMHIVAKQCGTSIEMLERHYSHIVPEMFADQLSGRK